MRLTYRGKWFIIMTGAELALFEKGQTLTPLCLKGWGWMWGKSLLNKNLPADLSGLRTEPFIPLRSNTHEPSREPA